MSLVPFENMCFGLAAPQERPLSLWIERLYEYLSRCPLPTPPVTMATSLGREAVHVPRLALPSPEIVGAPCNDVDSPAFRRQINVAIGRAHSQRTPRRDVIFRVERGGMVEKQRIPLAMESSVRTGGSTQHGAGDGHDLSETMCTPRYVGRFCMLRWRRDGCPLVPLLRERPHLQERNKRRHVLTNVDVVRMYSFAVRVSHALSASAFFRDRRNNVESRKVISP